MTNAANEMTVFERVVERGSFAAAAQDVGLSPSPVSKLISRLERALAYVSQSHHAVLGPHGRRDHVSKRCREILAAIERRKQRSPRPRHRHATLRVLLPGDDRDHFGLHCGSFCSASTDDSRVSGSERVMDLVAENVDISMRTDNCPILR